MLAAIPLLPAAGFILLSLWGRFLSKKLAALIGCASVAASGIITLSLLPQASEGMVQDLFPWVEGVAGFGAHFAFRLDTLSATMASVVCVVGLLIHIYSVEYMAEDEGFARFFAYLNLFIAAMLTLLLADDLLLMFLGWEGVGVCSYLLIGFWYKETANGAAAQKAFLVTRVGDGAFLLALFLFFMHFGTLSLQVSNDVIVMNGLDGSLALLISVLFLIAAAGKSAQLPLHIWLPDAMAGPTPVSALIHAATMVTAGVYLIARLHTLFLVNELALLCVGIAGAVTALYAGVTALAQNDIKRVLAYSTISQIGYMFLGLGVGAFSASLFHFFTHAFFKALLFLGAGAVIHALHGEQDMHKMGGLRHKLPIVFWTFVAGSAALAALPLVSAGFYSKDAILGAAFAEHQTILWGLGIVTAGLTGAYTLRMVWMTFMGPASDHVVHVPGPLMRVPLILLAIPSVLAGFLWLPHSLGGFAPFVKWLQTSFVSVPYHEISLSGEIVSQVVAAFVGLTGIGLAWYFLTRDAGGTGELTDGSHASFAGRPLAGRLPRDRTRAVIGSGFYIDQALRFVFVGGFRKLCSLLGPEWIDHILERFTRLIQNAYSLVSASQNGLVRWYAAAFVIGIILLSAGALWP